MEGREREGRVREGREGEGKNDLTHPLSQIPGYATDCICLSHLHCQSYGCDGLLASHSYLNELNVCWNDVYRKIFGMNKWETVKCVQMFCERLDFIRIFET